MNTSMKPIAVGLASLGRGDDKMLVHMTPGEVHGLQKLALAHGGSLTINPHTGLPEAGFLSSILPTIAGAALMATPFGAAIGPWGIAGLTGGVSALTSGSLKKGLMAGLGAFGGAGLGKAVAELAPALQSMTPEAAALAAESIAPGAMDAGIGLEGVHKQFLTNPYTDYSNVMGSAIPESPWLPGREAATTPAYETVQPPISTTYPVGIQSTTPYSLSLNDLGGPEGIGRTPDPRSGFEKMAAGAKRLVEEPSVAFGQLKNNLGGWKGTAANVSAALAPMGLASLEDAQRRQADQMRMLGQQAVSQQPLGFERYRFSPGVYNPLTGQFEGRGSQYLGRSSTFAQGGTVPDLNQRYPQSDIAQARYATSSQSPMGSEVLSTYAPKTDPFTGRVQMASGGIAGLHEYKAGGRLLDGPGDGMSDSIPAVIKGPKPQRAALADGEFVVPADVVSHLGNGSTKAGAQRLYKMMDKVRVARVGTKRQGKQINPESFLPA